MLLPLVVILSAQVALAEQIEFDGLMLDLASDGTCAIVGRSPEFVADGPIHIPSTITHDGKAYAVTSIGANAFSGCAGFTGELAIPEGVVSIGDRAFSGCTGFVGTLSLPASLKSLGYYTFSGCEFTEVISINPVPPTADDESFGFGGRTVQLTVPKNSEESYRKAPGWSSFADIQPLVVECQSITLMPNPIRIVLGNSAKITARILPANTTDKTIQWSSDNEGICPVDQNGNIKTRFAPGFATITARCGSVTATCQVIVEGIKVDKIILNQTEPLTLTMGETFQFSAELEPTNTTDGTIMWTSSDARIGPIDMSGLFTAVKDGTVTVSAICNQGALRATCKVTIKPIVATAITLSETEKTMMAGDDFQLSATVMPDNTTYPTVVWKSSDESIATVDEDGRIHALSPGNVIISGTCDDVTSECAITVEPKRKDEAGMILEIVPGAGENGEDVVWVVGGEPDHTATLWIPNAANFDGVILPVTGIGDGAFKGNESLERVVIPSSVITIGKEAFASCPRLAEVFEEDGEDVLAFGEDVFAGSPIDEIYQGRSHDGRPYIDKVSLKKLIIGDRLTAIASCEYEGCSDIETVRLTGSTPPVIDSDVFAANVYQNAKLIIPTDAEAAYKDAEGWKEFRQVEEKMEVDVELISLNRVSLDLIPGTSVQLEAIITPEAAKVDDVTWASEDVSIATVSVNGLVRGIKIGETKVSVTSKNGKSAVCYVAVNPIKAESVELDLTELEVPLTSSVQLTASVLPANTTDPTVTWKSSDERVAKVAEDGTVSAVSLGTATITATCGNAYATCQVTIVPVPAENVTLNQTELTMLVGGIEQLRATVTPTNTTVKTVTWESSDASIVKVAYDGKITALKYGTAVITATCGSVSASCTVEVTAIEPTRITLSAEKLTLKAGNKVPLQANIVPSNVTDNTVTWTSSNPAVAIIEVEGTLTADGTLTALRSGTTTITARCGSLYATCVVTVGRNITTSGSYTVEVIGQGGADGKDMVKINGGSPDGSGVLSIPAEVRVDGKRYPVTEITTGAFRNRADITKVILPASMVTIGERVFDGCKQLTELVEEDGTDELTYGEDALRNAPLAKIYQGRNHTSAPYTDKTTITSVTIGEKVTAVLPAEYGAASAIESVETTGLNPAMLPEEAFVADVYDSVTLMVPDGAQAAYKAASGWKLFSRILGMTEIPIESIAFDNLPDIIVEGNTYQLTPTITPENATFRDLEWSSSNPEVATVSTTGVLTAKIPGTVTITATTIYGQTATCTLTVLSVEAAIEDVNADGSGVVTVDGSDITFPAGQKAEVFTVKGVRVATSTEGRVTGLPAGVYLVRIASKTYKVAL